MILPGLSCTDALHIEGAVRTWSEDPLTVRARTIWTAGNHAPIARSYVAAAREFVGRLKLCPGETVLDVACGTGTSAMPAAEAGAVVHGIDLAPYAIAQARIEARGRGCEITYAVGNAEALTVADDSFDATISMFGVMFAERPERAAAELVRVTRHGGRIALANWTPEGLHGQLARAHATPADGPDAFDWGREDAVLARLGSRATPIMCVRRIAKMHFPFGPAAVAELFATSYGPTVAALRALDPDHASLLRHRLARLFHQHNLATNGTTTLAAEYLDVQARVVKT
jgi:ubiquinone/menaquinone biosynthesis C-methylase UbiE